jgi:hypothetical protein
MGFLKLLSKSFLEVDLVEQGYFKSCADILTNGRTPQYVTIEPIMASYKC